MAPTDEGIAVHLQRCAAQLVTRNQLRDRFDLPRTVTHSADFPRRAAAERAADELRTSGYAVTVTRRGLLGASLEAGREDALDDDRAVTFTREVFDVVQRACGRYDGWSAEVIAEAQA